MSWSVKLRNLDQSLSVIDPDPSNKSITFCRPAEAHASVEDEDEDEDDGRGGGVQPPIVGRGGSVT